MSLILPLNQQKIRNLRKGGVLRRIYDYLKEKLNNYTSQKLVIYEDIIKIAKNYEKFINWNLVYFAEYNPVIKLKDGHFATFTPIRDISQNAQAVINLAEFCKSLDIKFFYVNLPNQICISEDKDVSGTLDFSNQNADNFLNLLKDSGVKYYDMRKILHDQGMNHHEAFYITDHHWTARTGLWAAREILKFLRNDYNWPVNPEILNPERFDYVIYPDWFLGSYGKKVTLAQTQPEDFTMIYPKFDTLLNFNVPSLNKNVSGDFRITYDMGQINVKDYYELAPTSAYNHGRRPVTKIENLLADNDKKLMLVYDSFSNCVIPFLALSVRHIETIDLRQFTGSLKTFTKQYKPDLMIVIYYIEILSGNNQGDTAPFNFR